MTEIVSSKILGFKWLTQNSWKTSLGKKKNLATSNPPAVCYKLYLKYIHIDIYLHTFYVSIVGVSP